MITLTKSLPICRRLAAMPIIVGVLLTLDSAVCPAQQTTGIPRFTTAAAARAWAESEQDAGNFSAAALGFEREATMRRAQGDEQAAEVEELRASRLATSLALAIPAAQASASQQLAKLEPSQGCLIGVRDEEYQGDNGNDFAERLGRPISITYDYLAYGEPFPMAWARRQAAEGRAIQIAWEPDDIGGVADDRYLEAFASDAARCRTGVFLRFGGEMNGAWTTWGRDPAAYKAAFRTVHDVMAARAPNVAMVWAPNQVPLANLDLYYPGDAYVDWVGISAYTVRYYDDDLSRPAFMDSPATMIDPIYRRYAGRKPICLVECGVSRRSRIENIDVDDYAAARLTDLLNAVRVRFPRLKMLCFFDRNNLTGAVPGRRLNDYSLPEGSLALAAVKQATEDPYFLAKFDWHAASPIAYSAVTTTLPRDYAGPILASLITYDLHPSLVIKQAGRTQVLYRPYLGQITANGGPLTAIVLDSHGRAAKSVRIGTL